MDEKQFRDVIETEEETDYDTEDEFYQWECELGCTSSEETQRGDEPENSETDSGTEDEFYQWEQETESFVPLIVSTSENSETDETQSDQSVFISDYDETYEQDEMSAKECTKCGSVFVVGLENDYCPACMNLGDEGKAICGGCGTKVSYAGQICEDCVDDADKCAMCFSAFHRTPETDICPECQRKPAGKCLWCGVRTSKLTVYHLCRSCYVAVDQIQSD